MRVRPRLELNERRRLLADARLYAITADRQAQELLQTVPRMLEGGVDAVQLRQKRMPRGELLELASQLAKICHAAGALLIVNDHLDIALLAGADGVHLGDDDLTVGAARGLAGPDLLIGASAATPGRARRAEVEGADYIGAGAAFASGTKADRRVIGPAGVVEVAAAVAVPVFAIGGIEAHNAGRLRAVGVTRACVIRALAEAADPEAAARELRLALTS